ncbi:aromatic ring-hydroxylating dioxygenase subunit alpha [Sphingobium indicum]|uniref:Aromatic ring-hydroxylating dioxygenase subunit alpha n=1 Tax=Sphingobium indicum TaxID=332055 RepID=A0A4Q4IZP2_9SPHN|nr:aromatic ring-hydroxylating dioxygenase subunit alpha [Sphingobium indicum]KEY99569.1 phthalate 4,5-dioxygenase [Sphingomonas sp. BHC-A]NYI24091.1 5,5'-dehydrodivanillate O-demethylase [Sphingobium indicum]RYL99193.1 aromatic ring-hydroxylating dioxygenase subunit alpha [Sphingobium indicum]
MLSEEKNRQLTQVGPGTPMGELLRRYWMPIAAEGELDKKPVKAVRLMGEDLVLYRDLGGQLGLTDRHCPHRRADLSYGFVEKCGIRCNYHGWLFDEQGACLEQPYEDTVLGGGTRDKVSITAYPVRALGGMIWAYLGPSPAPELPEYEAFNWPNGFRQIILSDIPCNWAQCQENSIDPVHFEWMHSNWSVRLKGEEGPYAPRHLKIGFEEFEHGFLYKRIREDTDEEHDLWSVGRAMIWPMGIFLGDHFEWRVPVDDENTLSVAWSFQRMPIESEPFVQERIPYWRGPVTDAEGNWISSHVMNQDFIAWVGQGRIADRTKERLGRSDLGIGLMRRQLFADMEAVARGEDPKGIIRDPALAKNIPLPLVHAERYHSGMPREKLVAHPVLGRHLRAYPYQYGQPTEVLESIWRAAGVTREDLGVGTDAEPME